jgi:hypothetical protein
MADPNAMRRSLEQMRQQIWPMMDALHQGMPEKREVRERRLRVLENVQGRLELLIRDVKSDQHLQEVRQSGLHQIPRDLRYGPAQAIQQRQRDLEALHKEAQNLAEAVRKLLDANGLLSPTQRAMKLGELMEKLIKGTERTMGKVGVPHGPGPEITAPQAGGAELSGVVNVMIFVWLAIQKLRAKTKENEPGKKT